MSGTMRVYDVAATCEALHRAPSDGGAWHGLELQWLTARPKADRSGAVVYALVRSVGLSAMQTRIRFRRVLMEHGALNVEVYRAARSSAIEAQACNLVSVMRGGL